jgi:serine/threonine protein phosphatase PrpC
MFSHNTFGIRSTYSSLGIFAYSRRIGTSHFVRNTPCEDFCNFAVLEKSGLVVTIVADGLGSSQCPLARFGSQQATLYILKHLLKEECKKTNLTLIQAGEIVKNLSNHVISRFASLEKEWNSEAESEPIPFFRGIFGTTLLVLIASKSESLLLHVGDGIVMANDSNGACKWLFDEAESAHYNNRTRELMSFPLLTHSFEKERFLTLCTDGLEKILPFERWEYTFEEKKMHALQKELKGRSSASNLSNVLAANLHKLLYESPVSGNFDSDDGAFVQLSLNEGDAASLVMPNGALVSNLGAECNSRNVILFGSRSSRSFSGSINVEFPENIVICSVVAFHEKYDALSQVTWSPQGVVLELLDRLSFHLLQEWGKTKDEKANLNHIRRALNNIALLVESGDFDGWSVAVTLQDSADSDVYALFLGSMSLLFHENGSLHHFPQRGYVFKSVMTLTHSITDSFFCGHIDESYEDSEIANMLKLVERPLGELDAIFEVIESSFTEEREAFVLGRTLTDLDTIGEWSNPGLKEYLNEQYFGVAPSGKEFRGSFVNRVKIRKNLLLQKVFKDLGLPDPIKYVPNQPLPELNQKRIFDLILGEGAWEKEQSSCSQIVHVKKKEEVEQLQLTSNL